MTPEGTDRVTLGLRLAEACIPAAIAHIVMNSKDIGVYDPETHVAVERAKFSKMAATFGSVGRVVIIDPEEIERWSE